MLYKNVRHIVGIGDFIYEITKHKRYGVKITDNQNFSKELPDIFEERDEAETFVRMLEANEVTCVTLVDIYEDYLYDKCKKIIEELR